MDSPSIDDLLKHVSGMFELAAIAGKRAVEIKKGNRDTIQPLQKALEEIEKGMVLLEYRKVIPKVVVDGGQIELPLEIDGEEKIIDPSVFDHVPTTPSIPIVHTDDDDEEEEVAEFEEELVEEIEEIEDEDHPKDFIEEEIDLDDVDV
jgi:DNA-directed RNA polymerase omega subunit